jgi:endonuclease/exonuclease/phosphatase family metal-dependent hydrolase
MVYNIHAGKDADGVDNLPRVAEIIRSANPDFVMLQEVDRLTERSGRRDQLRELENLTDLHGVFGNTLDFQGGQYGIAVLSRWPDIAQILHALPVEPPQERAGGSHEPRGVLQAAVASPYGTIYLLNTHLDPSPDDSYRLQEAARVQSIAHALMSPENIVVIGGDFNATPGSETIHVMSTGRFRDAWVGCGAGEGKSYPALEPTKRIDYLLIPATLECVDATVITSTASDHRPVVFGLRLPDR